VTGQDRQGKAPFSIRASVEFKTHVRISQAAYLQTLIDIDTGKRSRRPGKQNIALSEELAKIHKAIIACGNRRGSSDHRGSHDQAIIDELVRLTAAVLQLGNPARRK
jgi:hypothetical protein